MEHQKCKSLPLMGKVSLILRISMTPRSVLVALALLALTVAPASPAQIYVANWGDNTITVLDADTFSVVTTISLGATGNVEDVAFTADGAFAFMTDMNSAANGDTEVVVIDTETFLEVDRIGIGPACDSLIFRRPGTDLFYVTDCLCSDCVRVIDGQARMLLDTDPSTPEIDGILLPLGSSSWPMDFSPDGQTGYIGNCSWPAGGIFEVDLTTHQITRIINVESTNEVTFAVAPTNHIISATGGDAIIYIDAISGLELSRLDSTSDEDIVNTQGSAFNADATVSFVVSHSSRTLFAVDISDPTMPTILSKMVLSVASGADVRPWEVEIRGNILYASLFGNTSWMQAIDVSDPMAPVAFLETEVGFWAFEFGISPLEVSPEEQIRNLIDDVEKLVDEGKLLPDKSGGLIGKLEEALKALDKSKPNLRVACNKLSDFIDQVNSCIQSGAFPDPADGLILIDATNDIISELCG